MTRLLLKYQQGDGGDTDGGSGDDVDGEGFGEKHSAYEDGGERLKNAEDGGLGRAYAAGGNGKGKQGNHGREYT